MTRLAQHGNGIALIFARTETGTFFNAVWDHANAILFIKGRIRFYNVKGERSDPAGAPSVLIGYGAQNAIALGTCGIPGRLVTLKKEA